MTVIEVLLWAIVAELGAVIGAVLWATHQVVAAMRETVEPMDTLHPQIQAMLEQRLRELIDEPKGR